MEEQTPRRRDSDHPRGKLRKGMYILPSLFTTANIAAGFYAILQTVHGTSAEAWHLDFAAMAIGFAVLFDGLDGRVARMTHTASDFGRELDSLADVITFGVAPALLAWMWGFHLLPGTIDPELRLRATQLGSIACFAFLMAGASRLARFNIAKNPQPSNPGRPGKKYFVGMPIPAGAQLQGYRFSIAPSLSPDCGDRRGGRFNRSIFPACALCHRDSIHGFRRPVAPAVDLSSQDSACTSGTAGGISHSMSPLSKPPLSKAPVAKSAASQADLRGTNLYRVAIVGAASLKGKEIAEILRERNFPAVDVRLLDDDESLGQLEAVGDEMSFIQSIRSEQFERVDFTFFASDPRSTRNNWRAARDLGDTIVDLSFALEEEAGASIRSPWIERQTGQPMAPELQPGPVVVAHPAATVLALLALRSEKAAKIQRMVATVFEPASENGQKGMDELHEQTINLLSFQELPKNVFDIQVAFNMVPRYGQRSELALEAVSQRIRKHYRQIASGAAEPSLQVLQAPVFHGHGFSVYLEMEKPVAIADFSQALAGEHVVVSGSPEDTPTSVSAAGQGDILVSLTIDANHKNGVWLWATTDNLRVAALTAVECAETMTASRPRGQIQ